ncbi:zinc finger MYM-type 1-like [Paramuricea clavata]|uniref:Zinc finger MYM-type 1-like n=1 Tax=Paramuricea clavata TaxID=317549 RepID=A0A7D9HSL9_PARCT|nr:zinc finger MYM-type 1-like [Paramuricea clavata]
MAIDYAVNFPTNCGNVIDMTNEQNKKLRQTNCCCLLKIIENLQSLCRQGQAIQGNTDTESNFYQLMKLWGRDDPVLLELLKKRSSDKYTSHDIQNEIIEIMAHEVQQDLIKDIGTGFFSIIADEYTDIGNKEQLTLCFQWVDGQLDGHEDFLGFYNIPNIASETIVQAIKDSLIRLQLSLSQCRGQCYDGASNMLGKKSGVAKQIQECEAKALPTHCHGYSLSLGVKDATNNCHLLSNTMNTNEIVKLVKYSPKRENLLGELKENLQYEDEEEDAAAAGLTKFSMTRWTVRAICLERVIDNYNVILKLWDECLKTKL